MYTLEFYRDPTGHSPLITELMTLNASKKKMDQQLLRKSVHQLNLLAVCGLALTGPQVRSLRAGSHPLFMLSPQPRFSFFVAGVDQHFVVLGPKDDNAVPSAAVIASQQALLDAWLASTRQAVTTWETLKPTLTAIPKHELTLISFLAVLQAERLRRGLTQIDFAERTRLSLPQIAKIERLDSTPSFATLDRYAEGLDLQVSLQLTAR